MIHRVTYCLYVCCRAKALPLIARGTYNHITGRRRGMPYTLADIRSVIVFSLFLF